MEYEKEMMKYKKVELIAFMKKIRDRTEKLREFYKSDIKTEERWMLDGESELNEYITKLETVIKTYLGECK